jgi:hypothetical protein
LFGTTLHTHLVGGTLYDRRPLSTFEIM